MTQYAERLNTEYSGNASSPTLCRGFPIRWIFHTSGYPTGISPSAIPQCDIY